LPGSYIISRLLRYSDDRVWVYPADTQVDPVQCLANLRCPLCKVARCGETPSLLDYLAAAEGVLPSPPLHFQVKSPDQAHFACAWGPLMLTEFQLLVLNTVVIAALVTQFLVWGPLPMLSEFQLWILSTIVMVALVVVCVALPG